MSSALGYVWMFLRCFVGKAPTHRDALHLRRCGYLRPLGHNSPTWLFFGHCHQLIPRIIYNRVAILIRGHVAVGVIRGRARCAADGSNLILCIGSSGLRNTAGGG